MWCQESHGKTLQGESLPVPHNNEVTLESVKWKPLLALAREDFMEWLGVNLIGVG